MADLIAQGPRREQRWRRALVPGEDITIGREAGAWSTAWDEHISRRHIEVRMEQSQLRVEMLDQASNPVFFQGVPTKAFRAQVGQHFVIGNTTFTLVEETASVAALPNLPVTEQTFSPEYLRHFRFRDPGDRLEILSQLPEQISRATTTLDLHDHLLRAVFEGIPSANAAAVCAVDDASRDEISFLHWDRTDAKQLNASRRLISQAVKSKQTVVHTWKSGQDDFTQREGTDWAFCVPFGAEFAKGWALYVSGTTDQQIRRVDGVPDLREQMKFAEIAVTTVGSFHQVRSLQQQQASLGQFFSEPVINALRDGDTDETLAPREVEVTVLFCDLRGFTRTTEQFADDLLGLLNRVSDALGVLTKHILHEGGVIGDFHGDAAMGFWGWPLPQKDAAVRAARAALAICREYQQVAQQVDHSLAEFRIGVGIASGRVVAGKIGTVDQVKVTAFGPAVNLASRLENMTKHLNAPILIDAATARIIDEAEIPEVRRRRLAVIRPYGMDNDIDVHELIPSFEDYPVLDAEGIARYEAALDAFVSGDWRTAWEELHKVPAADTAKDFLTTYIASRNRQPPEDWDGVIRLDSK